MLAGDGVDMDESDDDDHDYRLGKMWPEGSTDDNSDSEDSDQVLDDMVPTAYSVNLRPGFPSSSSDSSPSDSESDD